MNVNILLYDDFDVMDLAGPVSVFGNLPKEFHLNYLSLSGDVINSTQGLKVWTEYLEADDIDGVLVLPGGRGARRIIHHDERYINVLKKCIARADACLMVANAAGIIAQTGALFRRNVASYDGDENWKRMFTAAINWIPDALWVADGKMYSCKNPLASLDMSLGAVADLVDVGAAEKIAEAMKYEWKLDDTGYY
ncbi:MAG: peptidase [Lachnospiraceae bacterium]|jgi:putative intracellular protease/amidase|nr:peptidase [Lachnospiraceae bacterium]